MENILIIEKEVAKVTDILAARDFAPIYNGVASATLANAKSVQFVAKKTNGKLINSVVIPFERITSINLQEFKAPILPVLRIGLNTAANTALPVIEAGEGIIAVNNRSYKRVEPGVRKVVSMTKRESQTALQYLTKVVAELNNMTEEQGKFFTATLETAGTNHHILITALNRDVDIDVQLDGMFALTEVYTVVTGFGGFGYGEDVVEMEMNYTKNKGNHGYREWNERYFSEELEAKKTEEYALLTINWKGEGTVGSAAMNLGNNTLTLAAKDVSALPVYIFAAVPGCPVLETEEPETEPELE